MSGEYYQHKIHQHYPYMPVFTVGPYIQYAQGIYSDEKVMDIKKRNGKTAVVFLPHSIEDINRKYSKKQFIHDVMNNYKKDFDHFILCVYWTDILDDACNDAKNLGMKVVTSGFRFDPSFNDRVKTIIQLSDAVIGGDRGTHFMYSLYMGKPIGRIPITDNQTIHDDEFISEYEKKIQFDEVYVDYNKQFYKLIDKRIKITETQKSWLNPYCGFHITRSPDDIKNILEISRDIWLDCDGFTSRYPDSVRSVYRYYDKQGEIEKMCILRNATGTYLD